MHVGAAAVHEPLARHVVVVVPESVYPLLQEYIDVEPVAPFAGETAPLLGALRLLQGLAPA